MKTKLAVLFALFALVPFAVAACGDDDDDDDAAATEAATTETTDTGGDAGGTDVTAVQLEADPDGGLAYVETSLQAPAGEVTIELTNDASLEHDVQVEDSEGNIGGTDLISGGETADVSLDLAAGEYTYYCSVPGHREGGMEGTLTVE